MIYQASQIFCLDGKVLPHGISCRNPKWPENGNMSFSTCESPEVVRSNRDRFVRVLDLDPSTLLTGNQVHGTDIHVIRERNPSACEPGEVDGLLTACRQLPIGILVADCCCLLMTDIRLRAVGAFHAGWRGVDGNMAARAVAAFESHYGIPAADLRVWIGPAICGDCYEVSEDLWSQFKERWGESFLQRIPFRIDLKALNRHQFLAAGVPPESIEVSPECTLETTECFSHRRGEELNGRMLGVIALP